LAPSNGITAFATVLTIAVVSRPGTELGPGPAHPRAGCARRRNHD